MTQAHALTIALALLSLGVGLWAWWGQVLLRRELDAAWASIDDLTALQAETDRTLGGLHGGR